MGKTSSLFNNVIKTDPRVSDAFHDEDGYWVYLKDGWGTGDPGEHIIHADRVADVAKRMRWIEACECEQCKHGMNFHRG